MYSRGRRGAPAKGVGRVTGARVQISPSPPIKSTTAMLWAFSFAIKGFLGVWVFVLRAKREGSVLMENGMPTDSETKKGENEAKMAEKYVNKL